MKKKRFYRLLTGFLFLLAACGAKPTFINHAPPDVSVSFDVFREANLPDSLGCSEILEPASLLGGLEPSHAIAVCVVDLYSNQAPTHLESEIEQGLFIYGIGGLSRRYTRYVIFRNGEFVLIKTEDEFREAFAPIESPEEALSYALALTRLSAYYGLAYDPAIEYEVSTLEDTFAASEPDGYRLHLYEYQLFGCGPHWTSTVDMHVSFDGALREISREQVFRNPEEDGLCVD